MTQYYNMIHAPGLTVFYSVFRLLILLYFKVFTCSLEWIRILEFIEGYMYIKGRIKCLNRQSYFQITYSYVVVLPFKSGN